MDIVGFAEGVRKSGIRRRVGKCPSKGGKVVERGRQESSGKGDEGRRGEKRGGRRTLGRGGHETSGR